MIKPYSVWWKRQGEWVRLFETDQPVEAKSYARDKIVHGGITERIEIRGLCGTLEAVFDKSWT